MIYIQLATQDDMLKYAIENGIINLQDVQSEVEMRERKRFLEQHPYEIWQGKDGYWRTYLPHEEKGRILKKKKEKRDIENVVIDYYRQEELNPVFKDVFYQWLDEKLKYEEICKGTYGRYKNDYLRFFAEKEIEKIRVKDLTENYLYDFVKTTICDLHLTAKAYAGLRTILKGVLKYSKRKGYTDISGSLFFADIDIGKKSFKPKIKDKSKEIFLDSEIKMIAHYVSENPTIRNLGVLLAFQTGVRSGELAALKREDLNLKNKTIHIQRTEITYKDQEKNHCVTEVRDYPKTEAGDRYIIITDNAVKTLIAILRINPFGEYLFEENGRRIRENGFGRRITRICDLLR